MRPLILGLLLAAMACAGTGPREPRPSNDVLTAEEIEASDQLNALDLVRTLRPSWLRTRGPSSIYNENPIMVYVDGSRLGGPDTLSLIPSLSIERMRFYSGPEAQSRFGLNHTNGAIEVFTRRG